MSAQVFIVMLRRPRQNDPRADPFWEFGSFGCTGCHRRNLLHPKKCQIKPGDRLAFVQGGEGGFRLVLVTPPITRRHPSPGTSKAFVELRWDSTKKPFRYWRAPLVLESSSPKEKGLFPKLAASVADADRSTITGKFASRFRSRSHPLEPELASEVIKGFAAAVKKAQPADFIRHYDDALPQCDCPTPTSERRRMYKKLIGQLTESKCRPRRSERHR
jgi:hypothetical protein